MLNGRADAQATIDNSSGLVRTQNYPAFECFRGAAPHGVLDEGATPLLMVLVEMKGEPRGNKTR